MFKISINIRTTVPVSMSYRKINLKVFEFPFKRRHFQRELNPTIMGQRISQAVGRFFRKPEPEIRVGMLGLDNAGKTTILYKLKDNAVIAEIVPTVGFNVETIRCGKHLLNIWDVSGGHPKSRAIWRHYNQNNTKAIIFVIDAADVQRLPLAAQELKWLWWRPELTQAIFLIFANKQDLPNALTASEIADYLDLQNLTQQHPWAVQECCALTGAGLWQGLQQLLQLYEERPKKCSKPFKR